MLPSMRDLLSNKILRIGILSLSASVMTRAIVFASTIIFSRILTTAEYGMTEVFLTYSNIFMVVLGLDIHGIFSKGRLDYKEDEAAYACSSILMTTISATVIVAICNMFYNYIYEILGLARWVANLLFLYSYALFLINFRTVDYNFFYKYKKSIFLNVLVGTSGLLLSVFLIIFCLEVNPYVGRIVGTTIPAVIAGIVIYAGYIKRGKAVFKWKYNRYSLKYGICLIPSTLSFMLLSSSDRVMINNMISADASGIYSLSYTLGMMVGVVGDGMNSAFGPWLFRHLDKAKNELVTKVQRLYLLVYCGFTVIFLTVSPEILKLIGSEAYWEGIHFIIWIVFAIFLNFVYTLYVNIEFFYRKTALISLGTFLATIINITLNAVFLNRFGYMFAAATTVIAYFALMLFHMLIVNLVLKVKIVDNFFVLIITFGIFMVAILMNVLLDFLLLRFLMGCIAISILGILFLRLYRRAGGFKKLFQG